MSTSTVIDNQLIQDINFKDPVIDEIGYMNWGFVQTNLPHSKPLLHSQAERKKFPNLNKVEAETWSRKNGNIILTLQARKALQPNGEMKNYGIPFGCKPRLCLAWMTREVIIKSERRLYLGDTFGSFLRSIGIEGRSGGGTGTDETVKDQLQRLLSCHMTLTGFEHLQSDDLGFKDIGLVDMCNLWWDDSSHIGGEIVLNEKAFNSFSKAVPVDLRILLHPSIKRSPFAIDLYCWLTFKMEQVKAPMFIKWSQLMKQFGADYSAPKSFKMKFKEAYKKVKVLYGGARLKHTKEGVCLMKGRPSVLPKHLSSI